MKHSWQILFWSLVPLLFIFQLIFTLNSQTQIRYEELAESVRNPFWLEYGMVYDGVSSNLSWYGSLLMIYKLFGFHLYAAQFFKLALYLVSMICVGLLLKKYLKHAWLPLLVIGLSPTLLYYNTSQTSHGIDLLYFPIVLLLITHARSHLARLAGWGLAMWAWMSYPTFIFYLPVLFVIARRSPQATDVAIFLKSRFPRSLRSLGMTIAVFLFPLVLAFAFIKNRSLLIFDSQISSGIFRGGGGIDLSLDNISKNLAGLLTDLFVKGSSYHFEVNQAEFSLIFPIISVAAILFLGAKIGKRWERWLIGGMLAVLILISLISDPSGSPGMRRYTPVLAAFYALYVLVWKQLVSSKFQVPSSKFFGVGLLSLLLIHHLIVYPINLTHLKDPSPERYPIWFSSAETPQKSLDNLVGTVQKEDLKLVCLDEDKQPFYCRLSEVYAAVTGSCKWNHLECYQILGWDHQTSNFVPLNLDLWNNYYFEH